MFETSETGIGVLDFPSLEFWLGLFRISCFEFRILIMVKPDI